LTKAALGGSLRLAHIPGGGKGKLSVSAMQEIDLSAKTDYEIDTWIRNFEKKRKTDDPFYKKLLEERAKRQSRGLKSEVSLRHLIESAQAERYTTYGDLARASGVPWNLARHAMNGPHGHLDRLLEICHARDFPLLTAICVNQEGLRTGTLTGEALKGFIEGARRLGHEVTDENTFLRECQRECFEWAKSRSPPSS
jgi:hypothetical protein